MTLCTWPVDSRAAAVQAFSNHSCSRCCCCGGVTANTTTVAAVCHKPQAAHHLPSMFEIQPFTTARVACLPLHTGSLGVVDVVIAVDLGDQALRLEQGKAGRVDLIAHLDGEELALCTASLNDGHLPGLLHHLALAGTAQGLGPLLQAQPVAQAVGHVHQDQQLLVTCRQEGLGQVAGTTLPLLSGLIDLSVGSLQHLLQQVNVLLDGKLPLSVQGDVEEHNSTHSAHASNIHALLATLLDCGLDVSHCSGLLRIAKDLRANVVEHSVLLQ
mmetsp:Transcript_29689/g.65702  ORF Transcript_29689/g.65702 Transcript_29689/m.65702 type:complete len:271 (-) Transcript_29689:44-856(-)